jgi:hypothetical protein
MSTTPDTTVSTATPPGGGIGHWFANQIANLGEFAISRVAAIGDVSMFAFQTVAWIFARRQRREVLLPAFPTTTSCCREICDMPGWWRARPRCR